MKSLPLIFALLILVQGCVSRKYMLEVRNINYWYGNESGIYSGFNCIYDPDPFECKKRELSKAREFFEKLEIERKEKNR